MPTLANQKLCECGCGEAAQRRFLPGHNKRQLPLPEGLKRCTGCQEVKRTEDFYRRSRSPDGLMPKCKKCDDERKKERIRADPARHAEFVRRWEKANPEKRARIQAGVRERRAEREPGFKVEAARRHKERHPEKVAARRAVRQAVKHGRLVKPDACEDCGKWCEDTRELHGHHEDYAKKLDVEWLCRGCHLGRHGNEPV